MGVAPLMRPAGHTTGPAASQAQSAGLPEATSQTRRIAP